MTTLFTVTGAIVWGLIAIALGYAIVIHVYLGTLWYRALRKAEMIRSWKLGAWLKLCWDPPQRDSVLYFTKNGETTVVCLSGED